MYLNKMDANVISPIKIHCSSTYHEKFYCLCPTGKDYPFIHMKCLLTNLMRIKKNVVKSQIFLLRALLGIVLKIRFSTLRQCIEKYVVSLAANWVQIKIAHYTMQWKDLTSMDNGKQTVPSLFGLHPLVALWFQFFTNCA